MMVFLTGGEGIGSPLQYSCLENPMDRGAWRPIVHRVTKSWLRLSMHAFWLCEVISHCSFDLHFSSNGWCWTSFQHLAFFVKNKVPISKRVYLWAFFLVPLVYISVFCVNTTLFWWLKLCSIIWSQEGWLLQPHSSFSRQQFLYFYTHWNIFINGIFKNQHYKLFGYFCYYSE